MPTTLLRVRTVFTGGPGAPLLNTLFFEGNTPTDATNAAAATRAFWNAFQGIICDVWKADVQPEVVMLTPDDGSPILVYPTTSTQIVMAASNTGLPQANQAVIRLRTGAYEDGREIRGRIYVPGLNQNSNNQGDVATGTASTLLTAANTLIGATAQLVVYRRERKAYVNKKGVAIPYRAGSYAPVTAASVWNEFGMLRSRRI